MRFLFISILVSLGIPCNAQTFGVRVGGNIAWQMWRQQNITVTPDKIFGPHIGISVASMQLKNLASQLEAGYSIMGHGGYSDSNGSVGEDRLKFISIGCWQNSTHQKSLIFCWVLRLVSLLVIKTIWVKMILLQ